MGVLKFRLTPPELSERLPELRRGYFTGLDRTPSLRGAVELHAVFVFSTFTAFATHGLL